MKMVLIVKCVLLRVYHPCLIQQGQRSIFIKCVNIIWVCNYILKNLGSQGFNLVNPITKQNFKVQKLKAFNLYGLLLSVKTYFWCYRCNITT